MNPTLLLTLEYPPQVGGVATYLSRMVECFPEGDIQVLAQKPARSEEIVTHEKDMESTAPIYRRPLVVSWLRPRWLPALFHVDWLRRKEGLPSSVIVSHVLPLGLVARRLKRRHGVPYCLILHGMDAALAMQSGGRKRRQASAVVKEADLVVANSRYTASLAAGLGADPQRVMIVHPSPGFPVDYDVKEETRQAVVQRFGLAGRFTVMAAGRLVRRKGFDDLIAALARLREEGIEAQGLIVGEGPDRSRLEALAAENGLAEEVILAGSLPDDELAAAYSVADVFVMAPRSLGGDVEGFGIVYLEANLFGTPVIGTRSGGVPDAIVDGQTGLLVDPGKPDQLAAAIKRLHDFPELRQQLGRAGQERTIRGFHWTDQCRPLVGAIWHMGERGGL